MVVHLPTQILASLFAPLMFTGLHTHSPLLTMVYTTATCASQNFTLAMLFAVHDFALHRSTSSPRLLHVQWYNENYLATPLTQTAGSAIIFAYSIEDLYTVDCIYPWTHSRKTCFHVTSNVRVLVSNIQGFTSKCEVLLLDTGPHCSKEDDCNQ